jgi:hypothetical protein
MIVRSVLLAFAFASAAVAQETASPTPTPRPIPVGPDAVWKPADTFLATMHKACDKGPAAHFGECFVAQMKKAGASEPALAFARRTGDMGYMVDFRDCGKVDIAHAVYPLRANQNQLAFLVNGDPAMLDIDDPQWISATALAANPVYADLLKRFPKVAIFPGTRFGPTAPVPANLRNGGQRFMADFLLKDGCRACTTVGSMKVFFDFDVNGTFVETQFGAIRARR